MSRTTKKSNSAKQAQNDIAPSYRRPDGESARGVLRPGAVFLMFVVTIAVVYRGAIHAPFIFDDRQAVQTNPSLQRLWPLVGTDEAPGPLNPPADFSTSGRPVVNFTFAVNYHFGHLNPAGYRLFNMLLHAASATLVWEIVRRTLALPFFGARFAGAANLVGLVAAGVWALHPLNTEAVIYITQRTELLMAFFYLATLYCSLRYWTVVPPRAKAAWLGLAALSCLAGMGCKEVMASAPVMVLLFERTFLRGSFRRALAASWPLYAALSPTWLLLVALHYGGPRSQSVGFHLGVAGTTWWFTQAKVLFLYLKLCVWPWPLSIHYEVPYLETVAAAWPWLLGVGLLIVLTIVLFLRRSAASFVLIWMFAILSPTLLVPIVTEIAVERRMYLPLAALVTLAVAGCYVFFRSGATDDAPADKVPPQTRLRVFTSGGAVVAAVLALVSMVRIADYRDAVTIWQQALRLYPDSTIINANLASELLVANRPEEALNVSRQALARGCNSRGIHNNLGAALTKVGEQQGFQPGQLAEAVAHLNEALRLSPDFEDALINLSLALLKMGQLDQALQHCSQAVEINPRSAQVLYARGTILAALGRTREAVEDYQASLAIDPESAAAHYGLALVLMNEQQHAAAVAELTAALRIDPGLPEAHYALAGALAAGKDLHGAAREYAAAVQLRPHYPQALNNLGVVQMNLGETDNALRNFSEAARQQPDYAEAQANLQKALEFKRRADGSQSK